ncbi:hypothetical protein Hypma_002908 [Hypsizygus marmoreus]|uniref:Uncharacterized protein n=1 Tax=Hypsizygus marmoreus TaxID=39966 RepID=A0A369JC34_HYPMA|nr:hypothetical protein Hypma_002908 [Hypsizygus marmoreus]
MASERHHCRNPNPWNRPLRRPRAAMLYCTLSFHVRLPTTTTLRPPESTTNLGNFLLSKWSLFSESYVACELEDFVNVNMSSLVATWSSLCMLASRQRPAVVRAYTPFI